MDSLSLFKNNRERALFFIVIIFIFLFNLFRTYNDYKYFQKEELFQTKANIVNLYPKSNFNVLKLKTIDSELNFTFFTSSSLDNHNKKFQTIKLFIVTKDISFFDYLKGFYAKSFGLQTLNLINKKSIKQNIYTFVDNQHQNKDISSLYNALFLATPINKSMRELCSNFGISHLVAISGFHLGVMSLVLYFILQIVYNKIHQKYFPYRNKRFDIFILISIILFSYLLFVGIVPSLLRAFVMFIFGLFLLRNNIKILSFETLLIIVLFIISIYPKLLFSLSLWFSISGVFYIFLFLHYFKNMNKYIQFILFNFWIYFAINPIVHYFFGTTSIEQLYSPILTVLFTIFYPLVAFLHLLEFGWLFDSMIEYMISYEVNNIDIVTPLWFFLLYLGISFYAIFSKKGFITLNILFLSFGLYLFVF